MNSTPSCSPGDVRQTVEFNVHGSRRFKLGRQVFGIQAVLSHQQISKHFPKPGKHRDMWGQMNPGMSA